MLQVKFWCACNPSLDDVESEATSASELKQPTGRGSNRLYFRPNKVRHLAWPLRPYLVPHQIDNEKNLLLQTASLLAPLPASAAFGALDYQPSDS